VDVYRAFQCQGFSSFDFLVFRGSDLPHCGFALSMGGQGKVPAGKGMRWLPQVMAGGVVLVLKQIFMMLRNNLLPALYS